MRKLLLLVYLSISYCWAQPSAPTGLKVIAENPDKQTYFQIGTNVFSTTNHWFVVSTTGRAIGFNCEQVASDGVTPIPNGSCVSCLPFVIEISNGAEAHWFEFETMAIPGLTPDYVTYRIDGEPYYESWAFILIFDEYGTINSCSIDIPQGQIRYNF